MKKRLKYILLTICAAIACAACSKEEMAGTTYAPGEGGLSIVLNTAKESAGTRAETALGLDKCTVAIYDLGQEGLLVRKYKGNCPETINLLAGNYKLVVEYGEKPQSAALGKPYYRGEKGFTIVSGDTKQVDITIVPTCVAVVVQFDENTINSTTFESHSVTVTCPAAAGNNSVEYLQSTADYRTTGYFDIPVDSEHPSQSMTWVFRGDHKTKNEITTSGKFTVEAGKKYRLLFKFSPDLPGYIVPMILTIDESTENHDDHYNFSADPELAGDLFDTPTFTGSDKTFTAKATGSQIALIGLKINNGAERYIYSNTPEIPVDPELATLVSVALSEENSLATVTFRSAFFTFPYGEVPLVLAVTDSNASKATKSVTLQMNEGIRAVKAADYDLWTNTVTLRAVSSTQPTFVLRNGDKEQTLTGTSAGGSEYTATFSPEWTSKTNSNGLTVYTPNAGTGVWAGQTYQAEVTTGLGTSTTEFTTGGAQAIPYGNMKDSSLSCWGTENRYATFWGSGNNKYATALCAQGTFGGETCAVLKSTMAGALGINLLAAGNLFTGTFYRPSTTGTVSFGQSYEWEARPKALQFRYQAKVGTVNQQTHKKDGNHPLNIGDPDKAIVYVAIVDWENRHDVSSGTNAPSGVWSPDAQSDLAGSGKIIGYGIFEITSSTEGTTLIDKEIPIEYFDKETKPSKTYTLVISCATNFFGDYMCGCDSNELYITGFKWKY